MTTGATQARWRKRLDKELAHRQEFESLSTQGWENLVRGRSVTSRNHDTVLSLDWPHFCAHATEACGGPDGWCYTFQGKQAGRLHNRHAAMVDLLARREPVLFARTVHREVQKAAARGEIAYPNLRVSGSGEMVGAHIPALLEVARLGVWLWGFTRNLRVAAQLRDQGVAIIYSCDRTTSAQAVSEARTMGVPLGYSSAGVTDHPPDGTLVTFPVHRVGRVREVVDTPSLCPKVLSDFFDDARPEAYCQRICGRCHLKEPAR